MLNLDIDPNVFTCSFDESSLFTNVPFDETIKICSNALYNDSDLQPLIPKDVFFELMKSATSSVESSFNKTIYRQTDGVAMGLPLGLALANIFAGYYEKKLFSQTQKPPTYFRYVDDLPSSITKLKQMNSWSNTTAFIYPSDLPLKKRKTNVYRFLMFTLKEQILALKPVHTGNPLPPDSIYVGSLLVLSDVK